MAAGGEGLVQWRSGDIAAEAPEVTTSMQHPILKALDGGGSAVTGQVVIDGIAEILNCLLPDVPHDDPYRGSLLALACAARCQQLPRRDRLQAL